MGPGTTVTLNDGRQLGLGWLGPDQAGRFLDFAQAQPGEDTLRLTHNLHDPHSLKAWCRGLESGSRRLLLATDPEAGDAPVAFAHLQRGRLAAVHRGEVEAYVNRGYKNLGLGSILINQLCQAAVDMGMMLVVSQVWTGDTRLLASLKSLGFQPKAVMEDHKLDATGRPYDVIIVVKRLTEPAACQLLFTY